MSIATVSAESITETKQNHPEPSRTKQNQPDPNRTKQNQGATFKVKVLKLKFNRGVYPREGRYAVVVVVVVVVVVETTLPLTHPTQPTTQ